MFVPYRTEYIAAYRGCMDADYTTQDARAYAQLVVNDLRVRDAEARAVAGGVDVRDFSEPKRYDPADYLTPDVIDIEPAPPARQIKPFADAELVDASKRSALSVPIMTPTCESMFRQPFGPRRPNRCPKPAPFIPSMSDLFKPSTKLSESAMHRITRDQVIDMIEDELERARALRTPEGRDIETEAAGTDDAKVVLPAKSAIPKFIRKPSNRKQLKRLEDKWAGTLTDL